MDFVNREEQTASGVACEADKKFVVELVELQLALAGGGMGDTQL